MAITVNNTLPNDWNESNTYHEGDLVVYAYIIYRCTQTSTNNRPDISKDYWQPLEIYLKDATVMDHGQYSGDEEFWNRDNIYIDSAGWVYVNNENTGINVRGPAGTTHVDFNTLTPAQKEEIRGPQGNEGPQGPVGPAGPQGPMGEVDLTPEQVAALKGEDGKSTYEIWLEEGHTGTPADFLAWVRDGQMLIDDELNLYSENPVQNKIITQNLQTFRNNLTELVNQINIRLTNLENRLKYEYQGDTKYFKFGITTEGKYGYFYNNTSTLIPFDHTNTDSLISDQTEINNGNFLGSLAESGILQQDSNVNEATVINEPATAVSIDDMFHTRIYIYKDGIFHTDLGGFTLNGMYYNASNPADSRNLTSNGEAVGEGIVITGEQLGNLNGRITFVVNIPGGEGNILYDIGIFNNTVTLPEVIENKTNVIEYHRGSYSATSQYPLTYALLVNGGKGIYFGSWLNQTITEPISYKINEIYID